MAGDHQRQLAATALVCGLLSACSDATNSERMDSLSNPTDSEPIADLAASVRFQRTPDQSGRELLEAVLEACHGPVRGTMDRIHLRLDPAGKQVQAHQPIPTNTESPTPEETGSASGTPALRVSLSLPTSIRCSSENQGITQLLDGKTGYVIGGRGEPRAQGGPTVRQTTATEMAALIQFRDLCGQMLLQPLELECEAANHAFAPDNTADHVRWERDGKTFTLELQPGRLLPRTLTGPAGTVAFETWIFPAQTAMPQRLRLDDRGTWTLRIETGDVEFLGDAFAPAQASTDPNDTDRTKPDRTRTGTMSGGEARPRQPTLIKEPALRWLVLDDPGDWQTRHERYLANGRQLGKQHQKLAGYVIFTTIENQPVLAIPFTSPGGSQFTPNADQRVVEHPAQSVLLVFPKAGPLDKARIQGEQMLQEALKRQGRIAAGSTRAQPYLQLHVGVPEATELADCVVRMTLPVRPE